MPYTYTDPDHGMKYQSPIVDQQFERLRDTTLEYLDKEDLDPRVKEKVISKINEITDLTILRDFVEKIKDKIEEEINGETV